MESKMKSFKISESSEFEKTLVFTDAKLVNFLQSYVEADTLYDDKPYMSSSELLGYLATIKSNSRNSSYRAITKELVEWLETENSQLVGRVKNMLSKGVISFETLQQYFAVGTEIVVKDENHNQGGRVVSSEYKSSWSGPFLQITYEHISSTGREFTLIRKSSSIQHFSGAKDVNSLPVSVMTPAQKEILTVRGKTYREIALGSAYYQLSGHMEVKNWRYWTEMRATGRCMIDVATYDLFKHDRDSMGRTDGDISAIESVTDEMTWLTDSYCFGFSFVTKQWGRFPVANLSEIQFRTEAFEQLVLDGDKKTLIKALVTDASRGFQDLISGKGGGCIFLLHGAPGVGKTLTAEAIAELLRRPLYSVTVGELGTDPESLEKNLRQILDVAQIWNAVILIDEADIFLEKRTSGDIIRNATVGIFLRLLEYHQGVMFLTTNRVTDFDEALHSRISIALRYNKLERSAREQIWANLLHSAKITGLNPKELSETDINGRQIKNTIRLAQGLARQEGVDVAAVHIKATIGVAKQFQTDLKNEKSKD